jgi:hypothetical protein
LTKRRSGCAPTGSLSLHWRVSARSPTSAIGGSRHVCGRGASIRRLRHLCGRAHNAS